MACDQFSVFQLQALELSCAYDFIFFFFISRRLFVFNSKWVLLVKENILQQAFTILILSDRAEKKSCLTNNLSRVH